MIVLPLGRPAGELLELRSGGVGVGGGGGSNSVPGLGPRETEAAEASGSQAWV